MVSLFRFQSSRLDNLHCFRRRLGSRKLHCCLGILHGSSHSHSEVIRVNGRISQVMTWHKVSSCFQRYEPIRTRAGIFTQITTGKWESTKNLPPSREPRRVHRKFFPLKPDGGHGHGRQPDKTNEAKQQTYLVQQMEEWIEKIMLLSSNENEDCRERCLSRENCFLFADRCCSVCKSARSLQQRDKNVCQLLPKHASFKTGCKNILSPRTFSNSALPSAPAARQMTRKQCERVIFWSRLC